MHGEMRVKELAGKTAFVTGAASGIGLGITTAFAQASDCCSSIFRGFRRYVGGAKLDSQVDVIR